MTEPAASAKARLRVDLLRRRGERSASDLAHARAAIARLALTAARDWRSVAAYRPLRTEPGSVELLSALVEGGLRVLTPVLRADKDLSWVELHAESRDLGVDAVRTVDALIVPALAVDLTGFRLGRGGGSYDRVLARIPATPTFALVFDDELLATVPTDPWDRPVGAAIAPSGVTVFEPSPQRPDA